MVIVITYGCIIYWVPQQAISLNVLLYICLFKIAVNTPVFGFMYKGDEEEYVLPVFEYISEYFVNEQSTKNQLAVKTVWFVVLSLIVNENVNTFIDETIDGTQITKMLNVSLNV